MNSGLKGGCLSIGGFRLSNKGLRHNFHVVFRYWLGFDIADETADRILSYRCDRLSSHEDGLGVWVAHEIISVSIKVRKIGLLMRLRILFANIYYL